MILPHPHKLINFNYLSGMTGIYNLKIYRFFGTISNRNKLIPRSELLNDEEKAKIANVIYLSAAKLMKELGYKISMEKS